MKIRISLSGKFFTASLVLTCLLISVNNSFSQSLSNGTVEFIFSPENSITQMVIWLEQENGEYIETVFITNFIGRRGGGNRIGEPDIDLTNGNRLSALPVWAYKRNVIDTTYGIDNYYPPASSQQSYPDDIDAVSMATPVAGLHKRTWQLSGLPYGTCNCFIEVNKSFDTNDSHNYSYYRGQPSVVWMTTIEVGDTADSNMVLEYFGYGSPDGSDGDINNPDGTLTTAPELIDDLGGYKFKVIYNQDAVDIGYNNASSLTAPTFHLNQNYPNPFNNSTTISYHITTQSMVRLKIYDISGKEVQSLVETIQTPGEYNIRLNAKSLSTGIYLYKLEVNNRHVKTKKMLLIR